MPLDEFMAKPIPISLPMNEMAEIDRGPLHRPRNHLTTVISNLVMESFTTYPQDSILFEDDKVTPVDRALGTHLTGALTRFRHNWGWQPGHGGIGGHRETWRQPVDGIDTRSVPATALRFFSSSVPGNGLGAYNADPVCIRVEGGAQDGVAKGISGGRVVIMKGYNHDGKLIDGSVGKSLAYGGTGGLVIVQGNAELTRLHPPFGIRRYDRRRNPEAAQRQSRIYRRPGKCKRLPLRIYDGRSCDRAW